MNIEIGKRYTKRSGVTGKARSFRAVESRGRKIVCIADDNGRTVIVSRFRLHADSSILTNGDTIRLTAEQSAAFDKYLGDQ